MNHLSPVHFFLGLIPLLYRLSVHHVSICVRENSTKIIRSYRKCFKIKAELLQL